VWLSGFILLVHKSAHQRISKGIEIFKRDPWLRLGQRAAYWKLASTVEKPSASIRIDGNVTVVAIEKKKDNDFDLSRWQLV
jgi:hypothetical protein